jgi:hypothetical protein
MRGYTNGYIEHRLFDWQIDRLVGWWVFVWLLIDNPFSLTVAQGSIQPLTEMSTRNQGGLHVGLTSLPPSVSRLSRQCTCVYVSQSYGFTFFNILYIYIYVCVCVCACVCVCVGAWRQAPLLVGSLLGPKDRTVCYFRNVSALRDIPAYTAFPSYRCENLS